MTAQPEARSVGADTATVLGAGGRLRRRGGPVRPLRVLVLDHTGDLGGAELALVRLCAALGPEVQIRVLLFADGPLRGRLEAGGITVEVLELDPSVARLDRDSAARASTAQVLRVLRTLPFLFRLARRVRRLRPDVVHTTSLKADLLGIVPTLWARRPLVWHVHDRISADYLPTSLVRLVRLAARLPAAVVTNSRATAQTLPVPSTVVYPGFAPEQARATGDRVDLTEPGRPVVAMIGRISSTKGQLELVRAAPTIVARYPGVRLRIVGTAMFGAQDYATQVRAEAERLAVDSHVTWVDFTQDTAGELDRVSVFVHASPVPEPFGQVIVEAMIRGVPVVATRGGGVTEILEDDVAVDRVDRAVRSGATARGLLVAPGDHLALAAAVLAVLDDAPGAAARAAAAHAWATERFPVAATAQALTDVWLRAAGRGR